MSQSTLEARPSIVAPEERPKNQVDRLMAQIEKIQSKCAHDFRLTEPVKGNSRSTENVFLCGRGGSESLEIEGKKFSVTCLNCSKTEERNAYRTCPRCLGQVGGGNSTELRAANEKYIEDNPHTITQYLSVLCKNCNLAIGILVIDQ